ncbi:zona pellucida sperm-binding protein 3-like [Ambystoma mexicanum]|uniref:zona pellucida sperm-binding protein 3-like n=1 Tax=Ambystoma mexicanum TaxID=8296 RepID=UPI0037E70192
MAQAARLSVVLLCFVIEGTRSSPRGSGSGREWFQFGSSGSRFAAAPGIALSGPWSQSGSREVASFRPVTLQCQEAYMEVTVQRDLFGTGKLIQAADLRLGAAFCKYTSLNADNTITFRIALQDCGNTLQVTPDAVVYSSILTYNPTPSMISRIITRTNPTAVRVQCIYPRNGNVSSNAIQPTWIPFSSTVYSEETLSFSLRLMSDDWSSARSSTTFNLGDVFNIVASVQTGNLESLRIFVDSCVATLTQDVNSSPRYDIISSSGCLVDGKLPDSASAFISPRVQLDQLQFTVDAFRFIGDSRSSIYISCNLKAVPAIQDPDPTNKACSYNKGLDVWVPVEGRSEICSCCTSGICGPRRKRSALNQESSQIQIAVLGPLIVLRPEDSQNVFEAAVEMKTQDGAIAEEPWMELGLLLVASAAILTFMVLGALVMFRRCRNSS